jgi:Gpi18-like mannosyltransferase
MIRHLAQGGRWPFYLVAADGWLASGTIALRTLPYGNNDFGDFLLPWYNFILQHGRFEAFGFAFANYSPPYLYLISLGSLLDGWLSPVVIIKLISIVFIPVAAVAVYRIARLCGRSRELSLLAAAVFCAL